MENSFLVKIYTKVRVPQQNILNFTFFGSFYPKNSYPAGISAGIQNHPCAPFQSGVRAPLKAHSVHSRTYDLARLCGRFFPTSNMVTKWSTSFCCFWFSAKRACLPKDELVHFDAKKISRAPAAQLNAVHRARCHQDVLVGQER